MFHFVVMTTQASSCTGGCEAPPPEFPDMKSLFRQTIALNETDLEDLDKQLQERNGGVGSCCVLQVSN